MRPVDEIFSVPLEQIKDITTSLSITDIIRLSIGTLAVILFILYFLRIRNR